MVNVPSLLAYTAEVIRRFTPTVAEACDEVYAHSATYRTLYDVLRDGRCVNRKTPVSVVVRRPAR